MANDIHILIAGRKDTTAMTALSGWTQYAGLSGNNSTTLRTEVWWRRAQSGDTAPTVTFGSGTVLRWAQILGFRGANPAADPVNLSSRLANASSATVSTTGITPNVAPTLGLFAFTYPSGPTTATQPTGGWTTFTVTRSGSAGGAIGYSTRNYSGAAGAYGAPTTVASGQTNSINDGLLLALAARAMAGVTRNLTGAAAGSSVARATLSLSGRAAGSSVASGTISKVGGVVRFLTGAAAGTSTAVGGISKSSAAALAVVHAISAEAVVTQPSIQTPTGFTTTPGNLLVAAVATWQGGHNTDVSATTPITDTYGNVWTKVGDTGVSEPLTSDHQFHALYYAKNCLGGANHRFTYTLTVSDSEPSIAVIEISNADTAAPLDSAGNFKVALQQASVTSTPFTTPTATDIIIVSGSGGNGDAPSSFAAASGGGTYTIPTNGQVFDGAGEPLAIGYQIVSATGSYAATWNSNVAANAWNAALIGVAAFKSGAVITTPFKNLSGSAGGSSVTLTQFSPLGRPLRIYAPPGVLIGSSLYGAGDDPSDYLRNLPDVQTYLTVFGREYNAAEPENCFKMGAGVRPTQTTFDFTEPDYDMAFVQSQGQVMAAAGPLCWGRNIPTWLSGQSWTSSTLTPVMYAHIDGMVGHYAGKIYSWEVVNEPINTPSIWNTTIGSTYIDLAFRRARAADPAALLIINEWGAETMTSSASSAYYSLVSGLVAGGTPIDGVGFQFHLDASGLDWSSVATNFARYAALGLKIYITELDVKLNTPASPTDLATQASIYGSVFNTGLAQPAVKGIFTWGFTDKYSWIPSAFPGTGQATPLDVNYNPKPAYATIHALLGTGKLVGSATGHTTVSAKLGRAVAYPLKASSNGRYLVDQNNKTVWLTGDSPWSLISQGTNADIDLYFADRAAKGINAILFEIIEHKFADHAPNNIDNVPPFTGANFTTPNSAYFTRVDYAIQQAATYGITCFLFPLYLGFAFGDEGWAQEVKASNTAAMQSWATYIGNRYKNSPNVVWVIGGDVDPSGDATIQARTSDFALQLAATDTNHLISAHSTRGQTAQQAWPSASWLTLNSAYSNPVGTSGDAYGAYASTPTRPYPEIENWYENEHAQTAQMLRSQPWYALLAGTTGFFFGNTPMWYFSSTTGASFGDPGTDQDWHHWLNSPGILNTLRVRNFLAGLNWPTLVPDSAHTVITGGGGTLGNANYVGCARSG